MQLDASALAKETAAIVRKNIDDATAPLLRQIDELKRELVVERDIALETIRAEIQRGEELRTAEARAVMAELRETASRLDLEIKAKLLEVKDGKDGLNGKDGKDGEPGPEGKQGETGLQGERGDKGDKGDSIQGERGFPGERGDKGDKGDAGSQGERGSDGVDGRDAYVGEARGLYDPEAQYRAMDVVSLNGSEWRAKKDEPGPLPGEGWMLSAQRGKRGDQGLRGEAGPEGKAGKDGAQPIDMKLLPNLKLITTLDDGNQLEADLTPFARSIQEQLNG